MTDASARAFVERTLIEWTRVAGQATALKALLATYAEHDGIGADLQHLITDVVMKRGPSVAPAPAAAPKPVVEVTEIAAVRAPAPNASSPAPAAAIPGYPKPAPRPTWKDLFTTERNEIMRREYPAGTERHRIRDLINATPGPKITGDDVSGQATRLDIRRPPGTPPGGVKPQLAPKPALAAPAPPAPAPRPAVAPPPRAASPSPSPQAPPTRAIDPVPADFDQIRSWAAPRGVQFAGADDMDKVNKKRAALGQAPFELRGKGGR